MRQGHLRPQLLRTLGTHGLGDPRCPRSPGSSHSPEAARWSGAGPRARTAEPTQLLGPCLTPSGELMMEVPSMSWGEGLAAGGRRWEAARAAWKGSLALGTPGPALGNSALQEDSWASSWSQATCTGAAPQGREGGGPEETAKTGPAPAPRWCRPPQVVLLPCCPPADGARVWATRPAARAWPEVEGAQKASLMLAGPLHEAAAQTG